MTDLINELRGLNVLVMHPRDAEIDELLKQMSRIGCNVSIAWPVPTVLPEGTDLICIHITERIPSGVVDLLGRTRIDRPTMIGLIGYENPSVLQGMLDLAVHAVIAKPLRPFGVMSSILMARQVWRDGRHHSTELRKLQAKIETVQLVTEAKFILMRHRGIGDKDAYKIIRNQAMAKRVTTGEIAKSIVEADSILNGMV